jgi:hypothetical protein
VKLVELDPLETHAALLGVVGHGLAAGHHVRAWRAGSLDVVLAAGATCYVATASDATPRMLGTTSAVELVAALAALEEESP